MSDREGGSEVAHSNWAIVILAWLAVSLPMLWGLWMTVKKMAALFR